MPNPHVVDEQDAPMSPAEYEAWLTMRDAATVRVMEGGEDTTSATTQDFYD